MKKRKKKIIVLVGIFISMLCFTGCQKQSYSNSIIEFHGEELTLGDSHADLKDKFDDFYYDTGYRTMFADSDFYDTSYDFSEVEILDIANGNPEDGTLDVTFTKDTLLEIDFQTSEANIQGLTLGTSSDEAAQVLGLDESEIASDSYHYVFFDSSNHSILHVSDADEAFLYHSLSYASLYELQQKDEYKDTFDNAQYVLRFIIEDGEIEWLQVYNLEPLKTDESLLDDLQRFDKDRLAS